MEELVVKNITPVSFITKQVYEERLTVGQKKLLALMQNKISSNTPITLEDIKDTYYDAVNRNGYMNWHVWETGYRQRQISKEQFKLNCWSKEKSIQWFKSNLGACILKGKLLVIPIIEIEETPRKQLNPPI